VSRPSLQHVLSRARALALFFVGVVLSLAFVRAAAAQPAPAQPGPPPGPGVGAPDGGVTPAAPSAPAENPRPASPPAADAGAPAKPKEAPAAPKDLKTGKDAKDAKEEPTERKRFDLEGYVRLGVGVTTRPRALPRDRLTYGLRSSLAGIIVRGEPFEGFNYTVHFGVNPEALAVVTGVDIVDTNGDGTAQKTSATTREVTIVPVEEVSIAYTPVSWLEFKGGHFYMPFSPAAAVIVTSQMFPTRPGPTQLFMTGADQGLMGSLNVLDERIQVSLGVFNGSSLELRVPQTTALGPAYTAYLDVHPLGKMPRVEGDPARGPFRFALGGGSIFRYGVLYDSTGYESTRFRELRMDGAIRVSWFGLFLQAEVLRRLQTDEVSGRPASATGAYVQGSYYQPITTRLAIAPLARYGYSREDELYAPRRVTEIEAGIAFYPRGDTPEPDKLRFILQYDGEIREPESDVAHGGVLHAQLRW
jgi:hypothetical protein